MITTVTSDRPYIHHLQEIEEWNSNGRPAPPPHIVKQLIVWNYQQRFAYHTLVETGTYLGEMVEAQKENFNRVVSIELGLELFERARERFKNDFHVRIIQGDSGRVLADIVKDLAEPAIFWLDGHYSAGITAMGEKECPVFEELAAILDGKPLQHIILIDDARLFTGTGAYPSVPELERFFKNRNSAYSIEVHHDVIRCTAFKSESKNSVREEISDIQLEKFLGVKSGVPDYRAGDDFLNEVLNMSSSDFSGQIPDVATEDKNIGNDPLRHFQSGNLWQPGQKLRLHLGCGEQYFEGYINIDYPPANHNVMNVKADAFADLTKLNLPPHSVDEIRLHHVFEHFNRVHALGMLIRWHRQLKIGGVLHIETPDLIGSAKTLLSAGSWKVKMGNVRHLAGDQAASWAYHLDHWFPERFEHTLAALGFGEIAAKSIQWPHEPNLSNVTAIAVKQREMTDEELFHAAKNLLWESTVADSEKPTHEVWVQQLRTFLKNGISQEAEKSALRSPELIQAGQVLQENASQLPIEEIYDFNQRNRDRWVEQKAASVPAGSSVLDVGAGTCPYSHLFRHCDYKTHDFKQYEGVKLGNTSEYGHIDFVSDINSIPVPDNSFDVILCTEVLEHVPEPIAALREMARIIKPGGRIFITAPLGSGLHQLPYHFYGGYTPYWYRHFAGQFGLDVREITSNGGFFRLLAQEAARVAWTFGDHAHLHSDPAAVRQLFGEIIPRYLFHLEEKHLNDQFTIGYHVELKKPLNSASNSPIHPGVQQVSGIRASSPVAAPHNIQELLQMAVRFLENQNIDGARRSLIAALAIEPDNTMIKEFLSKLQSLQP